MKTFYVTTPIYYANSLPHMGHLYTTVVADFLTRHHRQRGFETYFLTGTDEHGTNIERASAKAGRTPKEHVDYIVGELKKMFGAFGLDTENGGPPSSAGGTRSFSGLNSAHGAQNQPS